MTASPVHSAHRRLLADPDFATAPGPALFTAEHWPQAEPIRDGRGAGWFIQTPSGRAVLKHYRRGGMIARISRDRYLFTGWSRVRALAEFHLLKQLREQQLPVPRPLAAMGERHGLFYHCALITQWIDHQETLTQRLRRVQDSHRELWPRIGRLIATLAAHNVDHVDFNPDNVLLGASDQLHIIDFDNARRCSHDGSRQVARLVRGIAKRLQLRRDDDWLRQAEDGLRDGAGLG